ncbi:MAG: dihydropteroate synthase [Candidatus Dormiibacterota bacterium]
MSEDRDRGTLVHLTTPYPELSTLSGGSQICLSIEAGANSAHLHATLAALAPAAVSSGEAGSILLEGKLADLLGKVGEASSGSQDLESLTVIREVLERLISPAPALRVGETVWEFGERTYLLGVLNVTPDSFSGDGVGSSAEAAVARALRLVAEGADAIDIGGESTRPGHQPVSADEELSRVLPALELIVTEVPVPIFVDTSKAEVASAALGAGAHGVNDIWGLRRDPDMASVVAEAKVPVICMHNHIGSEYLDLMRDLLAGLRQSLRLAEVAGIPRDRVVLDPGIGFGKVPAQNYQVLRRLCELRTLGCPIMVGTSRKSLIGWLLDERPVAGRLLGTAATVAWSITAGADIVRVHDVAEIRDVTRVLDALARRPPA